MKIAIMSFAHTHAITYASLLRDRAGVELLVSDPEYASRPAGESGGRSLAEQLGVDYVDNYDELFGWGPDAVIVCSENAKHRADVERAAAAGAHVLCEKPLATAPEDAQRMLEACDEAGVLLMTAFPVRFSHGFEGIRELVQSGALGRVLSISGTNNGRLPIDRAWFTDKALSGGGAVFDHTVHVADMIFRLFPGVEAVEVFATANRLLHPQLDVETAGLVSIRYSNGVTAVIDCSWSKPAHYPTWGGLTIEVMADEAIAETAPFSSRVEGYSEATRTPIWLAYGQDLDAYMLDEFIGALEEGRQPLPSGADGYRTLEIVAAAYESIRTGQPVRVAVRAVAAVSAPVPALTE